MLDAGYKKLGMTPTLQCHAIEFELASKQPGKAVERLRALEPALGASPDWKVEWPNWYCSQASESRHRRCWTPHRLNWIRCATVDLAGQDRARTCRFPAGLTTVTCHGRRHTLSPNTPNPNRKSVPGTGAMPGTSRTNHAPRVGPSMNWRRGNDVMMTSWPSGPGRSYRAATDAGYGVSEVSSQPCISSP